MVLVSCIVGQLMVKLCIQMYTHIYYDYHSHILTTFNLTLHKPILKLVEEISTKGPIHLYSRVLLNPHALNGNGQPEVTFD